MKETHRNYGALVKRTTFGIVGVSGGESHVSLTEQISNRIIEENFPKLRKDIPIQVQEANRTPSR